jgi:hypothetical protein
MTIAALGGKPFPLRTRDATELARIWKGCTQATGHTTHKSRHHKIDVPELDHALRIIVRYIEKSISLEPVQAIGVKPWTDPTVGV